MFIMTETIYRNDEAGIDLFLYENPESPAILRVLTPANLSEIHVGAPVSYARQLNCVDPQVMDELATAWLKHRNLV